MPTSTKATAKVPRPPNVAFSCCSQQSEVVGIRFFRVRLHKCTEGRYPLVQHSDVDDVGQLVKKLLTYLLGGFLIDDRQDRSSSRIDSVYFGMVS